MPDFKFPYNLHGHNAVIAACKMVHDGHSYEEVSDFVSQLGCRNYCIERLFYLGLVFLDGLEFSDSSRDFSLKESFNRYITHKTTDEAFEIEKELLLKEQKVLVATDSVYSFDIKPFLCDEAIENLLKDPVMTGEIRESYFVKGVDGDIALFIPEDITIVS